MRHIFVMCNKSVVLVPIATGHEAFVRLELRRFTLQYSKSRVSASRRSWVRVQGVWIQLLLGLPCTVTDSRQTALFPRIKGLNLFRPSLVFHPRTGHKTEAAADETYTACLSRDLFSVDDYFPLLTRNILATLVSCHAAATSGINTTTAVRRRERVFFSTTITTRDPSYGRQP